jgi:hypothetical protein
VRLVQHYNDLTEINNLRSYYGHNSDLEALKEIEKQVKTYVCFSDVKLCYPGTIELMDKAGWKVAKKTCDWHQVHGGDSELRLYYKLFPNNKSDINDKRTRAGGTYPDHRSLAGSCSMGLIDNIGADWLKSPGYPERYLTLVRLTRKRTKEEIAKMRYFHYTLVFKSDVARYFANGWHPDKWPGYIQEHSFWNTAEAPKIDGFVYKVK